ncbi:hypothetical protein AMTR_s00080p00129290 [Amborella trichopoda]|uniref:Uncharacterized protein n=2 Tax=Amborella trichopoda TaxID=13333 RepID=W1PD14_AMBTC|nr:hypothetical protein AMTR_s00080p00129290 [Amborella trichopoda]
MWFVAGRAPSLPFHIQALPPSPFCFPPLPLPSTFLKIPRPPLCCGSSSCRVSAMARRGRYDDPIESSEGEWEEPDYDGEWTASDSEEVEEEEDDHATHSIDTSSSFMRLRTQEMEYRNLVKQVEQLLEPEEIAILQNNEAPVLNKISTPKWSPIHTLAASGQIAFMDKLLELDDASVDAVDKDGFTALHKAVIAKKEAVISHLLRAGANPHVRDEDGATLLHYAVQVGAMQTVKLLIKYKVDINIADDDGWTPLHVAIQSRCRDIAKVLLVNGADKTRRTKDGKTALDLSLCYGREFKSYELAKLLKLVPADGVNRDP